eukprot:m.20602 g.20602  ORF g.20602 m.20602 type:complete len:1220 (-) comp8185_c0_seq1:675-4334(-)
MAHSGPIFTFLGKVSSIDHDFRFMACNDLINHIEAKEVELDERHATKVSAAVLKLLTDSNSEVQNIAVKCFAALVPILNPACLSQSLATVVERTVTSDAQVRDISSLALKNVLEMFPSDSALVADVVDSIAVPLSKQLSKQDSVEVLLEALELLTIALDRFGGQMTSLHDSLMQTTMQLLAHRRALVCKKAISLLASIAPKLNGDLFAALEAHITNELKKHTDGGDIARTLVDLCAKIAAAVSARASGLIASTLPAILQLVHTEEQDELRETCLQCIESYARSSPTDIKPQFQDMLALCIEMLNFDPLYSYDTAEDEEDESDADMFSDDDSFNDEDFADDDDFSWKVRRSAAKALRVLIGAVPNNITNTVKQLGKPLLVCFREHEDNVRVEVFRTTQALMNLVTSSKNVTQASSVGPDDMVFELVQQIPNVMKFVEASIKSSSIKVREEVLLTVDSIACSVHGAFSEYIDSILPGIQACIETKSTASSVKAAALKLLQSLVTTADSVSFADRKTAIVDIVTTATNDTFYRTASQGLTIATALIKVLRPDVSQPLDEFDQELLRRLLSGMLPSFQRMDTELELRETSITAVAALVATAGDCLSDELQTTVLPGLLTRLQSEVTRSVAAKALATIATCPLTIPMDTIFEAAVEKLAQYLNLADRSLRIACLTALVGLVNTQQTLADDVTEKVLSSCLQHIDAADLQAATLGARLVSAVLERNANALGVSFEAAPVLPSLLQLFQSPLLHGAALTAAQDLMQKLVDANAPGVSVVEIESAMCGAVKAPSSVDRAALRNMARCITVAASASPAATMARCITSITNAETPLAQAALDTFTLGFLGLNQAVDFSPETAGVVIDNFKHKEEELRAASAYAIGCITAGHPGQFLDSLLAKTADPEEAYLSLVALREFLSKETAGSSDSDTAIWNAITASSSMTHEATRKLIADCISKLVVRNFDTRMEEVINMLANGNDNERAVAADVGRHIVSTIQSLPQKYRSSLAPFFMAAQDTSNSVRRLALQATKAALLHSFDSISPSLDDLLPIIYGETDVRKDLVRMVQLGPFQHKVDDGLETRKSAFECLLTMLSICPTRLNASTVIDVIVKGLQDGHDIQMVVFTMITKALEAIPTDLALRLDEIADVMGQQLATKPAKNAVKQEVEKLEDMKQTLASTAILISKSSGSDSSATLQGLVAKIQEDSVLMEQLSISGRATAGGMDTTKD